MLRGGGVAVCREMPRRGVGKVHSDPGFFVMLASMKTSPGDLGPRVLPVLCLLCAWILCTAAHAAGPRDWVTVYENSADGPQVRLDRLPQRRPAIDGVLAMLSFLQTPFGCSGPRGDMTCPITRELGLGRQCSPAHVATVQRWFPDRVPKLSGYHARHYTGLGGKGPESWMCAETPEGASVQDHLSSVRIRQTGRRLVVESRVAWYARERSGDLFYRTTFRLDDDAVTLLSHKLVRRTSEE